MKNPTEFLTKSWLLNDTNVLLIKYVIEFVLPYTIFSRSGSFIEITVGMPLCIYGYIWCAWPGLSGIGKGGIHKPRGQLRAGGLAK